MSYQNDDRQEQTRDPLWLRITIVIAILFVVAAMVIYVYYAIIGPPDVPAYIDRPR